MFQTTNQDNMVGKLVAPWLLDENMDITSSLLLPPDHWIDLVLPFPDLVVHTSFSVCSTFLRSKYIYYFHLFSAIGVCSNTTLDLSLNRNP